MTFDFPSRIDRIRRLMHSEAIDLLLLSAGADLLYLAGYEATPSERLTMLVLPLTESPVLVVPQLETPRVRARTTFELRPWSDAEDPLDLVVRVSGRAATVAVGDQTWASVLLELQERMPGARFVPSGPLMRELRMRKDLQETACLRRVAVAADRVVERLHRHAFAGKREADLAREIAEMTVEEGHDSATFAIVAAGENGASPHHEPGGRKIQEGDAVVVDFGGRGDGYCSDTSRCFHVGEPSGEYRAVFDVVREAQTRGVAAVGPGVAAESVDRAVRRVIEEAGYGEYFVHRTGHGIGLEVHEHPYIVEGNRQALEPGMAFSIEPGIYLPGKFGIRIEDVVVVTEDGVERLNRSPRNLSVVE